MAQQFGAGPQFAAQCPRVLSPDGWRPWTDVDGPVPSDLASRAQAAAQDESVALGATESYPLPGVTALIRIEPRVWGKDAQGALIEGCFRAGGIYLPSLESSNSVTPPTSNDKLSKAIAVLTVTSLAVGTAATLASWSRK